MRLYKILLIAIGILAVEGYYVEEETNKGWDIEDTTTEAATTGTDTTDVDATERGVVAREGRVERDAGNEIYTSTAGEGGNGTDQYVTPYEVTESVTTEDDDDNDDDDNNDDDNDDNDNDDDDDDDNDNDDNDNDDNDDDNNDDDDHNNNNLSTTTTQGL